MRTFFDLSHQRFAPGQGGLLAVAITILIALVIGASTLSGLSMLNATRSVVMKQTLQTYYAAQAGLQEAVATRMVPRSNYLNFDSAAAMPEFYSRSGLIYKDPTTVKSNSATGLMALYRYVVVGGDAARKADGNYYSSSPNADLNPSGIQRLIATETMPTDSSFVVISNGMSCISTSGSSLVATDQLQVSPTPSCKDPSKYKLDEITLVAQVQLTGEYPSGGSKPLDKVTKLRGYKDHTKLRMPLNAFLPGYGWAGTNQDINFQTVWAYSAAGNNNANLNPLKLQRVVFYNFADGQIFADQAVNANQVTVATKIPAKSVIRLYFNGPFDYRSISPLADDRQLSGCQGAGASSCRLRVMQGTDINGNNGVAYTGNTLIPLFPGGTQVIMLPPLTGTINGGVRHAIRVDASRMSGYSGTKGPNDYKIIFTTQ